VRAARGDADEAEALYRRALAIKERRLGRDHFDVAITLNHLALRLEEHKRVAEAKRTLARALRILERRLGPRHPTTRTCRESYEAMTGERIS
jgi:hypothetical protein